MYRSFITCDDPEGVVECGTIRKSKRAFQKVDNKIKSQRTDKKEEMVSQENSKDCQTPSSFQLLEVSRGAQKLNHLIGSWSKGLNCDGQSKDIAEDLLKGALDLQESLTMLGKLQEASQYMAQLKKRQKEKVERGGVYEARMSSHRLGERLRLENPRLSIDSYSGDCIEELRNAIRDGLARQNLLKDRARHEKINPDRKNVDLVSHFPSTSSSRHAVQLERSRSAAASLSETALQKKEKSPNLIAKLMGLESMPSNAIMQSPEKQFDREKNSSPRRPVIDIEMPKLKKSQSKIDPERRTLQEILESVHYKSLLKRKSTKEHSSQSHQSCDIHCKRRLIDDIPPIVLIKPMRVPRYEFEELPVPMVWEEEALSRKMMKRNMKTREEFALRSMDEKRPTSNSSRVNCRAETKEPPFERIIEEEGAQNRVEEAAMPEEKEVRTINQKEEAGNVKRANRNLKVELKASIKRQIPEGAKECKEINVRKEEKEAKKKQKDSSKMKTSGTTTHQNQKKETTDMKIDKVQKVAVSSRKPPEKEITKTENGLTDPDHSKMTSARLGKPDRGLTTAEVHILQRHNSTRKTISKNRIQNTVHNLKGKQEKKHPIEQRSTDQYNDNIECIEDEKQIDLSCKIRSEKEESTTIILDQQSMQKESNASESQTEECCDDSKSSIRIITVLPSECERTSISGKEADDQMTQTTTDSTSFGTRNRLKDLLLSSPQFLNLLEDGSNLDMSHPKISPTYGIYISGDSESRLTLACADELTRRRKLQDSQTRHPLLFNPGYARFHSSLDQLLEEVCIGFESLESYHKLARDIFRSDSIYAIVERDIMCNGLVNGMWDFGWKYECSSDEVEQIVSDLEKLLVSELMEEVFS